MKASKVHCNHSIWATEAMITFQTIKDQTGIPAGTDPSTKEETPNIIPLMHPEAGTTALSQWT